MNVLHIWDQAGVAAVLSRYLETHGVTSRVVKRAGFDKYQIDQYYGTDLLKTSTSVEFYLQVLRDWVPRYDLIHVHSQDKLLPFIRKPKIIHYHGSEIRGKNPQLLHRFADKTLVSTPDLTAQIPSAEWLPNPVDREIFNPEVQEKPWEKPDGIIPYWAMPYHLKWLGTRDQQPGKTRYLSKLSLETLAVGSNVNWNGLQLRNYPEIHEPERVAKRLHEIYLELLE